MQTFTSGSPVSQGSAGLCCGRKCTAVGMSALGPSLGAVEGDPASSRHLPFWGPTLVPKTLWDEGHLMPPGPPCQETGLKVHPWGLWEKHSIVLKKRHFFGLLPATIWAEWPDLTESCASSSVFLQLSFTVLNWSGRRKLLLMVCRLQTPSPVEKLKGTLLAKTRTWEELRELHWFSELGHYLHPHVWEVRAPSQLWNLCLQPPDCGSFYLNPWPVRGPSVLDTPTVLE